MFILLIIYNILYILLYPLYVAVNFFVTKDKRNIENRLGFLPKEKLDSSVWIHAASVGEVNSLAPVVKLIRENYPETKIVISTMTNTGLDMARMNIKPDVSFLLPIENRIAFANAVNRYGCKLLIILETELWPNMIYTVSSKISVMLLNARMSEGTYRSYKRYSFLFKPMLKRFSAILAKSDIDADRYRSILSVVSQGEQQASDTFAKCQHAGKPTSNRDVVESVGNIKYAHRKPTTISDEVLPLKSYKIALAASTHDNEEELFAKSVIGIDRYDKIVIVPRHITRVFKIVADLEEKLGVSIGLFSDGEFDKRIIIVDRVGVLESLYQIADRIFVGGSLVPIGGHNIFEALQYSKGVCVGPHMDNFSEIIPLALQTDVVKMVEGAGGLVTYFNSSEQHGDFKAFFKKIDEDNMRYYERLEGCIRECIYS